MSTKHIKIIHRHSSSSSFDFDKLVLDKEDTFLLLHSHIFVESRRMIMVQTTTPSQSNGIDIRDALSILSSRAKAGGDSSEIKSSSDVPSELKAMGQQIDIVNEMEFAKPNTLGCDCIRPNGDGDTPAAAAVLSEEEEKKHAVMKAEREKRTKEIQNKLQSMNVGDLLGMIFTAQGERVATYKLYDE